MTLTIHVPDAQAKALAEEMEQRGYAVVLETEDVPNWHKEGVERIRAQTAPEAYIPLDTFLKEWDSE